MSNKIRIGISQGDINGISYEIIIKALTDTSTLTDCRFIIYGSSKIFAYYKKNFNSNLNIVTINSVSEAKSKNISIINCNSEDIKVDCGKSTEVAGLASYQAFEKACFDLKEGNLDILITCPINKKNIQAAGFEFLGHTEYLAKHFGNSNDNLMLLFNDILKIGIVTAHTPVKDISTIVTKELIVKKISILNNCLKNDFLISKPKIAVLSLNPHCGDDGIIGTEEIEKIIPAINEAKKKNILAFGTYSADGFFGSKEYKKFDAVLAMYHDQGLAPFKIIAFEDGVNYTAGISIVRVSPVHGTAYDIAGKGIANELSLKNAIYSAIKIYKNRITQKELEKKKLNLEDIDELKEIPKIDE